ncbi:MAG: cell wall metabolism sensor histidine kinase WalK [Actinobacteria bacterium]|nr:cell wall metabolism sensor histidine kinase WalK [Actinomycetota bacterium]
MPIRWRLTLFIALVIGAILLALGLALLFFVQEALLSGVEDTARSRALEAAETMESGETLEGEETERLTLDGIFVVVRDGEGGILTQTVNLPSRMEESETAWSQALQGGSPAEDTVEISDETPVYVYAVPVDPAEGPARVVEAGQSYEATHGTIETFGKVLIAVILGAFLLSVGGAYLLARAALSPVGAVAASARKITESDLSDRLPVTNPKDEIGGLASTINGLLSRLEAAFARREEALRKQEEALSSQRRFAADASHELRTPLTNIEGYSEMLKEWALRDPETARESVDAIGDESKRMREMVESLLSLARGDEGAPLELESQDIDAVVADAVRNARAAAGSKVTIKYRLPEGKLVAAFDRARVHQAISILLDNAIKYTPEGGEVRVEARERGSRAEIVVSDTGVGLPEEQLPLVFERFYRVDKARTRGGAGLGLAIARQIAEAHGGGIEAQSEPGRGSTFVLRIPLSGPTS